jgi:hypothetical protein
MSTTKLPTLSQTVPVYDYLFETIKEFQIKNNLSSGIDEATNFALQKLEDYYSTSDGLVYIIATSIIIFFIILLTLFKTLINLYLYSFRS